jgi:hypothetical protein
MILIYLKTMTMLTEGAFTLMEKANFRLDTDNIGLIVGVTVLAFITNYFSKHPLKMVNKLNFSNMIQSAILQ